MPTSLKDYLVRLAIDPDRFCAFVADPISALAAAGVSEREQQLFLSGDQNQIYTRLAGDPSDSKR